MTNEEKKNLLLNGELPEGVRKNNTFKMISGLLSYIGCICVTLAVMHYIDGTAGVMLTTALICGFVISVLLTAIVARSISVEITVDKPSAAKGDTVVLTAALSKGILLPAPVIEIYADCTPQLAPKDGVCFKAALVGSEVNRVEIPFTANFSGAAAVGVKEIRLTDFLGIFSFKLKRAETAEQKLAIYPNIPDAAVQTDFLKTTTMFVNNDDDDEESDETSITPTGLAGYEHRSYIPGDPIKRINWKLSSKRDEYMIRLDEKIAGAGQMFFLDAPKVPDSDYTLAVRDRVIEGALAVFTMLIRESREATFFYPKDGLWLACEIHGMGDVFHIQELLSEFKPDKVPSLIPSDITSAGKVPICFTAATAEYSSSAVQIASAAADGLVICSLSSGLQGISNNLWTISDEFEFRKHK